VIGNQGKSLVHFRGPLMQALVERGCEVFALAPDLSPEEEAALRARGVKPVTIPMRRSSLTPLRDLRDIQQLARILRRLHLDAVFGYFAKPVIYGSLAAKLARIPNRFSLIAGLGYAFVDDGRRSWKRFVIRRVLMALYRFALRGNIRVFFQNPEDRGLFLEKGIVKPAQALLVNGTGVDLDAFPIAPAVTEPVTFLLAARLIREKGIADFVEAARILRTEHGQQARFLVLGGLDSNPSALSRQQVTEWVEEGLLEWVGEVDDVKPWLAQSSVFVLPSYYREGVPRSIQEAMALGRPIITTDTPGCRKTVIDGENGFLVPPLDSRTLASAMKLFIEDPEKIRTMGRRSRELAEERFDSKKINQAMITQILGH
jgi:glycosyltransferase involved in cell wall biosynthesis